uniref:Uncharacterized protein n=1 Tax=Candidatus Methanomethylicus mesodigestus TaxID=1867258 RepID=A0A7C3J2L1_9CREN
MPTCDRCRWWKVDIFYCNLGTCEKRQGVFEGTHESCDDFKKNELDSEFVWCADCRTMVHKSELERHKGHQLSCSFCCDDDASEYISAGD